MSKLLNRKRKAQRHIDAAKSIKIDMTLDTIYDEWGDDYEPIGDAIPVWVFTARIDDKDIAETHDVLALFHECYPINVGWDENKAKGQYFLTCSCGHAGCAGYWEPIVIRVKKDTVQWSTRKEHGYRNGVIGTGENVVYLKRDDYEECRKFILDMFRSSPDHNFMIAGTHMTGREWLERIF